MKKLFITIPVLSAFICFLTGCDKNEIKYGDFDVVDGSNALLKVNMAIPYKTNPTMYIGIDGKRVSNPITSRTPFPGGGYNTGGGSTADYMVLAPGKHTVSVVIPKKAIGETGIDSISLFETEITLEAGKNQSLHISDTGSTTNAFLLADDVSMPDSGFVRYKFVHLMPNVAAIDLYYGTKVLATNVPYKGSFEFTMARPTASAAWSTKVAGTSTTLASYTSTSTYTNSRVYTVFASGYSGLASPDTRRPYVSFYLNW